MASKTYEDLGPLVSSKACLNQEAQHPIDNALQAGTDAFCQSDADHQLLINVEFQQQVKLACINLKGVDAETAPKNVKIFVNQPHFGFEDAEDHEATQDVELTAEESTSDAKTELKFVKFQRVNTLQIFIAENQEDAEYTKLKSLQFFGTTGENTVLSDWKPKKG